MPLPAPPRWRDVLSDTALVLGRAERHITVMALCIQAPQCLGGVQGLQALQQLFAEGRELLAAITARGGNKAAQQQAQVGPFIVNRRC